MHRGVVCSILSALFFVTIPAKLTAQHRLDVHESAVLTNPQTGETRSLFRFELPESISGQRVEYAAVDLQFEVPSDSVDFYLVHIHPMLDDWDGDTRWTTGLTRPGGNYTDSVGITVSVAAKRGYKARANITELVQLWADGSIANRGFAVVADRPVPGRASLRPKPPASDEPIAHVELYIGIR